MSITHPSSGIVGHLGRFLAVTALGLGLLGGCSSSPGMEAYEAGKPLSHTFKKNEVERSARRYSLVFRGGQAEPMAEGMEALAASMNRQGSPYGIYIQLAFPPTEGDSAKRLAAVRAEGLRRFFLRLGVPESHIEVVTSSGHPGACYGKDGDVHVEVVVTRYLVVLPGCPDRTSFKANFGCADAYNLGKMVANPRDLVEGSEMSPADATRHGLGVFRYRSDETKELQSVTL